ncbi:MAG: hypothetical protein FWC41_10130, partial [Firmicutes bacterium]|nr:hypothetical protein [Bacillota bacterium]
PIDVPFTEYSLDGTNCEWQNLPYDDKVIIINSKEELEQFVKCNSGCCNEIDFSRKTLLLVSGVAQNRVYSIIEKLEQLSRNQYKLSIKAILNDDKPEKQWNSAFIINKLQKEDNLELNLTTIAENIENLYDQPLEIIKATVLGKWQVTDAYESFWFYQHHILTDVFADITEKEIVFSGNLDFENSPALMWWMMYNQYTFTYSWEKWTFYHDKKIKTTYGMLGDNELFYFLHPNGFGYFFDKIVNDTLFVWAFWPPKNQISGWAYGKFVRVKS